MNYGMNEIRISGMKKKVTVFLAVAVILLFCSNIGLHMFPSFFIKECTAYSAKSYNVVGKEYTVTGEDPQLFVNNLKGIFDGVCIEFNEKLSQDMKIQVYIPDANGIFTEQNSYIAQGKEGDSRVEISFPEGEYSKVRIDADGSFSLKRIYQLPERKILAFADENACLCVWAICIILAICFTFIGFHISKCEKLFERGYCYIVNLYSNKIKKSGIKKIVLGIVISLFGGILVEFILFLIITKQYNKSEMFVLAMGCFLVYTIVFMRQWYAEKIEKMMCFMILMCGLIFTLVIPVRAGISWDDQIHYFETAKAARGISGVISYADQTFKDDCINMLQTPENGYGKEEQKEKQKEYDLLYSEGEYVPIEGSRVTMHSIGYIPAIIGMWIGFGLFLPFSATIILMRFVNVVFIAILLYFAMKNVKSGKLLIAAFALIPTVFFLASSFSYDTWLTMLMLYGFTRYFGELQRKDKMFTLRDFLLIFIPMFLALPPKIVYAPMLFLTAYMPSWKFKEKKWCYAYRACFIVAALVCAIGIVVILSGKINLGTGDTRGGDVNPMMQLAYIISDLPGYSKTLTGFLANYFSYNSSSSYLTFMAYAGEIKWQWFSIIILFFTAFTDRIPEIDRKTIPVICKLETVGMVWIIGAICATVMYLAFTPVGLDQINGCQGRYIIPALFPMLYAVSRFGGRSIICNKIKKEYYNMGIVAASVVFLMCNLWINIVTKY